VHFFSDDEIIDGIKLNMPNVVEYVYSHYYETIKWFIMRGRHFNEEDAKDIFQDAMVVIYQNTQTQDFSIKYSFKTYFFTIIKNIVCLRLHVVSKIEFLNDFKFDEIPNEGCDLPVTDDLVVNRELLREMKRGLFWRKFNTLPDDCRRILILFFENMPLLKIAESMGHKSENYAKKRKHMCQEFLKKNIKEDNFYKKIKEHEQD
jgi:RNA polymerase sigma factor (sigma-70 family)